jgi:hypothetical protein
MLHHINNRMPVTHDLTPSIDNIINIANDNSQRRVLRRPDNNPLIIDERCLFCTGLSTEKCQPLAQNLSMGTRSSCLELWYYKLTLDMAHSPVIHGMLSVVVRQKLMTNYMLNATLLYSQ